jgi:hypothetical protein
MHDALLEPRHILSAAGTLVVPAGRAVSACGA